MTVRAVLTVGKEFVGVDVLGTASVFVAGGVPGAAANRVAAFGTSNAKICGGCFRH